MNHNKNKNLIIKITQYCLTKQFLFLNIRLELTPHKIIKTLASKIPYLKLPESKPDLLDIYLKTSNTNNIKINGFTLPIK